MASDVTEEASGAEPDSGWDRRRRLLLSEYERVALELFATNGFRSVSVDDIAAAAGVSGRTLFRYFPTKEEYLLGFPRRGMAATVDGLAELEPSDDPLQAAWRHVRDGLLMLPVGVESLALWRRAAADAPEVVARVRGERAQQLLDAAADYCGRSWGVDPVTDLGCRLVGGVIAGVELAVVEAWGRTDRSVDEILEEADQSIAELDPRRRRKA